MYEPVQNDCAEISRVLAANGQHEFRSGIGTCFAGAPATSSRAHLRLQRSGGTVTASYDDGVTGTFRTLQSCSFSARPLYIVFDARAGQGSGFQVDSDWVQYTGHLYAVYRSAGIGCQGVAAAYLGWPRIGRRIMMFTDSGAALPVYFAIGSSSARLPVGLPGCLLLTNADVAVFTVPSMSLSLTIPNNFGLAGARVHTQWAHVLTSGLALSDEISFDIQF